MQTTAPYALKAIFELDKLQQDSNLFKVKMQVIMSWLVSKVLHALVIYVFLENNLLFPKKGRPCLWVTSLKYLIIMNIEMSYHTSSYFLIGYTKNCINLE